eukprot:jgi/Bigna1/145832/aug1.104_g20540
MSRVGRRYSEISTAFNAAAGTAATPPQSQHLSWIRQLRGGSENPENEEKVKDLDEEEMQEQPVIIGVKQIINPPSMNLSYAESQHQRALDMLRTDQLDEAIEILSEILEWRTKTFGEESIECAATWHHYGVALFKKARSTQGELGEATKEGIRQLSQQIVSQSLLLNETTNASSSSIGGGKEEGGGGMNANVAAVNQSSADDDEDGDDDAEDGVAKAEMDDLVASSLSSKNMNASSSTTPDDMELAWQALEVARLIYSKNGGGGGSSHQFDLAEVYGSLAELSLERAHFETAITDYKAAINSMKTASKSSELPAVPGERRLADLQFRLCLAFQLDGTQKMIDNRTAEGKASIEEGLQYCNETSQTLQAVLNSLEDKSLSSTNPKTEEDILELKEIMEELGQKAEEMKEIMAKGVALPTVEEDNTTAKSRSNSHVQNHQPQHVHHNLGTVGSGGQKRAAADAAAADPSSIQVEEILDFKRSKLLPETVSQTPAAD